MSRGTEACRRRPGQHDLRGREAIRQRQPFGNPDTRRAAEDRPAGKAGEETACSLPSAFRQEIDERHRCPADAPSALVAQSPASLERSVIAGILGWRRTTADRRSRLRAAVFGVPSSHFSESFESLGCVCSNIESRRSEFDSCAGAGFQYPTAWRFSSSMRNAALPNLVHS